MHDKARSSRADFLVARSHDHVSFQTGSSLPKPADDVGGVALDARRIFGVDGTWVEPERAMIHLPRFLQHGWVVHGNVVMKRVSFAPEPLDDAHLVRMKPPGPAQPGNVVETDH